MYVVFLRRREALIALSIFSYFIFYVKVNIVTVLCLITSNGRKLYFELICYMPGDPPYTVDCIAASNTEVVAKL
jgi:hypothetical protein